MAAFVIEVYRPGLTPGSVAGLVRSLKRQSRATGEPPDVIRYVGCTLAPADEVCYLRLESEGRAWVQALVDRLGWRDVRITEVVDVA